MNKNRKKVQQGKFEIGEIVDGKKIKSFGMAWREKIADRTHFDGQLWEPCSCGEEPCYLPSGRCESCINRFFGSEVFFQYAYFESTGQK